MALKIGDTVTIVIGQPLPADEPVDELIYTEMGYMPMSLLDLRHVVQDSTTFAAKGVPINQNTLQLTVEKVGSFVHATEYRQLDVEDHIIKRSAHVHTYDKLEMFPEQGNMN